MYHRGESLRATHFAIFQLNGITASKMIAWIYRSALKKNPASAYNMALQDSLYYLLPRMRKINPTSNKVRSASFMRTCFSRKAVTP